jgi:hypothetical protein
VAIFGEEDADPDAVAAVEAMVPLVVQRLAEQA